MKSLIFYIFIILCVPTYANDAYFQICVRNSKTANQAARELDFIKLATDKIRVKNECLDILTTPDREKLYLKFVRAQFKSARIRNGQGNYKDRAKCPLKITEIYNAKLERNNVGINLPAARINANQTQGKRDQRKQSTLILLEGHPGSIEYRGQRIDLVCHKLGRNFEIKFTSTALDFKLDTTRRLAKGEEIELGSILKESNGENNQKDISPSANIGNQKVLENYKLFLKVDE